MVENGVLLAIDMVEDALAQQEYVDNYCGQSKNIRMAVCTAATEQLRRGKVVKNVLTDLLNVRMREMAKREKDKRRERLCIPRMSSRRGRC